MARIFHLISEADWEAVHLSEEWRPNSLNEEGFIHCSKDEDQLARVAQRLYADRVDMLALEVDSDRLSYSLVTEASRSGELYPHIYGPLQISAVESVWRLGTDGNGGFALAQY